MSRIGKLPVAIPQGVEIDMHDREIVVKGPKGALTVSRHPKIEYVYEDGSVWLTRKDNSKVAKEQYGLRRTLLKNAVEGVSSGFQKGLELVGVGYKVTVQNDTIVLNVGYSQPKEYSLPKGIEARAEGNKLYISGIDKEQVGEVAARLRRVRPPEPYKGKGIKYLDEQISRKAGKSGKK
jgi:large subunit ribosomal protein L6